MTVWRTLSWIGGQLVGLPTTDAGCGSGCSDAADFSSGLQNPAAPKPATHLTGRRAGLRLKNATCGQKKRAASCGVFSHPLVRRSVMNSSAFPELEPAADPGPKRKTVLIIDDDPDQAFCVARGLESQGFNALTAGSGRLGLSLARSDRPDLIVLDLRLPDLDGLDICRELADSSTTSEVPIIILSGLELANVVRCARAAGCRYYLRKPFDPNVLLALVELALSEGV
jgi:CheY-like chemotaxis protein